jgi:SAM-dependent methyltransferase
VLDIGCGFGLFGCYFTALFPDMIYHGVDLDAKRIDMAQRASARLGLTNTRFSCVDARQLDVQEGYDAVLMLDLMHHLDDDSKRSLLARCAASLVPDGRMVIKDVTTHPLPRLAFTWALDVAMTRGFDMWYWDEDRFLDALGQHFGTVDVFHIADWLPYPHIVYLAEARREGGRMGGRGAVPDDDR